MSKARWVQLPLEPAPPWFRLTAFARCLGSDLFRVWQDRVVAGITMEQVEDVIVRMLAPDPRERKALRSAIRSVLDAGLIVSTEGGVLLLYGESTYSDHQRKDYASSTDRAHKVDASSTDGMRIVDASSPDHAPMVGANHAKPLDADLQREREKERKREGERERASAQPPIPELEPGEPECHPDERRPLHAVVRVRFEARYLQLRGSTPNWTPANVAKCELIAHWLDQNHGSDPRAALRKLLDGFFGSAKTAEKGFPIAFLANDPAEYFAPPRRITGHVPPAPASAFPEREQDPDSLFGPVVEQTPKKPKPRGQS